MSDGGRAYLGGSAHGLNTREALRVLTPEQVVRLDQALARLGPFGEVRLIKAKGKIRFIQVVESEDFLSDGG